MPFCGWRQRARASTPFNINPCTVSLGWNARVSSPLASACPNSTAVTSFSGATLGSDALVFASWIKRNRLHSSASGSSGFWKVPSTCKPSASAIVPTLAIKMGSLALRIITLLAHLFCAIERISSTPSIIGISRSINTTSTSRKPSTCKASTPLAASWRSCTPKSWHNSFAYWRWVKLLSVTNTLNSEITDFMPCPPVLQEFGIKASLLSPHRD